jgi:FdhE protein
MGLARPFDGACPVCGSLPILSTIAGEEGRRMLICSLCRLEWKIPRFACPFCQTEKQEGHPYLFIEGDRGIRIDVCDACMKYIKTIDTRGLGATIFPLLEDVATLHLDMLAQESGYQRGSRPFMEIG